MFLTLRSLFILLKQFYTKRRERLSSKVICPHVQETGFAKYVVCLDKTT